MLLEHLLRLSWVCLLLFSSGSGFPYQVKVPQGVKGPDSGLGQFYGGAGQGYYYDPSTGKYYSFQGGSSGSGGSGGSGSGSDGSSSGGSGSGGKYYYYYGGSDSGSGGSGSGGSGSGGSGGVGSGGVGSGGVGSGGVGSGGVGSGGVGSGGVGSGGVGSGGVGSGGSGSGGSGSGSGGSGSGGSGSGSGGSGSGGSGSDDFGGLPFYVVDPSGFDLSDLKLPLFPFPNHWLYPDVPVGTIPEFLQLPSVRLIQNSNDYQRARSLVAHTKYTQDDWDILPYVGGGDQGGQGQGGSVQVGSGYPAQSQGSKSQWVKW